MNSFTVLIQDRLYRRVFKNEFNNLILDYVSVGNEVPVVIEGECIGY